MKFYADIINGVDEPPDGTHYLDSDVNYFEKQTSGDEPNWLGNYLDENVSGYQYFKTQNGSGNSVSSDYFYDQKERAYFNTYFDVANGTKIYIKDFQITFTNREGNTEDIIYSVDYVNNGNIVWNEDTMSYDSWPTDSNVMIGFDMSQTTGGVTYSFYRSGNTVNGNSTNTTAYPLQNVGGTGYTDAILGQG